MQLADNDRSYLLWGSILFSALSVSYLVAVTELDLDKSEYRKLYSRVYGYIPSKRQWLVVFGKLLPRAKLQGMFSVFLSAHLCC